MLFVEDMHYRGTSQTTGCAFRGTACNNKDGEAFAIVDMTWKDNSRSGHVQHMAKTMAHEFGHLVSKFIKLFKQIHPPQWPCWHGFLGS